MEELGTALVVATVFYGIYALIQVFTDYLLKRKVIKAGHMDKAGILEPVKTSGENNGYPSLKWGLVALMAGIGLILIEIFYSQGVIVFDDRSGFLLTFGIELVFIASAYLIYFFILNRKRGK
jgi:hypothetical protein